ncbi:MAG: winged helix-turn-helix domain-containing protein [Lysobacter sp.]|nr:winged helix-turn-helix domain-containing protein [Lysobacter sp.]
MTPDIDPPWPPQTRYLRIGDLVVDLRYRRVRADDTDVDLPQRVFDLFLLLLAEPHALHSRADLFQRLWPGLVVEDANLTQSMWLLRRALGDSRKAWIRTVAKGGYVFEPPEPPQALVEPPGAPHPAVADTGAAPAQPRAEDVAGESPIVPVPRPAAVRRRRLAWIGLGALALAVAGWFVAPLLRDARTERAAAAAAPAPRTLTVVILEVKDDATARWPRKLLREWLAWKLDSLPEVQLISEADFAAGHHGANTPLAIFVSSAMVDDAPGQMRLRVRFRQGAQDRVLEARGGDADLPARIDALSRQVVARLLPARAAPWPALTVDATAARRYADAVDAIDRRDAIASTRILGEVIERAPRFGLARVQLAQAQKRLGLAARAIGEMDAAHALLRPAPPETLALFEAQRLSIDPKRSLDAANAFAALASGAARKPRIVLERARQLLDAGQPEHARALLSTPSEWTHASLGVRVTRQLLLSVAHAHLGDPERARHSATTAERLARQAGQGWELERGMALVVLANVDVSQRGERADTAGFLDAAALFESAGNRTSALYARFLAASARPSRPEFGRSLEALLAQARASGYVQLEIEILMRVAGRHHASGDMAGYRRYLEQALAGARVAGNEDLRSRLETVLLFDAYRALHLADADLRLQRLRASRPEGTVGMTLQRIDAGLDMLRGQHRDALDMLSDDTRTGDADEGRSEAQLTLACDRAEVRLQMGDLAGARADSDLCASSGQPPLQMRAAVHQAHFALLSDKPGETRETLRRVETMLETGDDGPDRWGSVLGLAALLTRAGDVAASDRLLASVEPRVARSGIVLHAVTLLAGQAENAAARGDWANARRHAAAARARTPPEVWTIHGRLALVDAADALAHGDRTRAIAIATRHRDLARGGRDAIAEVQFQDLLDRACLTGCAGTSAASRHGIRGSQIAWLRMPAPPAAASTPAPRAVAAGQASRRP